MSLSILLSARDVSYLNDVTDKRSCPLLNRNLINQSNKQNNQVVNKSTNYLTNYSNKSNKLIDKPVTFHKTVKSSGYGNIPSDIIDRKILEKKLKKEKQIKQLTNQLMRENQLVSERSLGLNNGLIVGSKIRNYRMDCDPMTYHMNNNNYPINKSTNSPITRICYNSDGSQLAFASSDIAVPTIQLPVHKSNGQGYNYIGHSGRITDVDFSLDKKLLLSSSIDKTIKLWRVSQIDRPVVNVTHCRHQPKIGSYLNSEMSSTCGSDKSNDLISDEIVNSRFYYMDKFICMAVKNSVCLYEYETESMTNRSDLNRIQSSGCYRLSHSWVLDGQVVTSMNCINTAKSPVVFAATSDRKLHVLDSLTGQVAVEFTSPHQKPIHHIALSQPSIYVPADAETVNYNMFATSSIDNSINMYDLRSTDLIGSYSGSHVNRRESVRCAISPCMKYLITGSEDNTFHIVDLRTLQQLHRLSFGFRDVVVDVAFHPSASQLACCSLDGTIKFFCDPSII